MQQKQFLKSAFTAITYPNQKHYHHHPNHNASQSHSHSNYKPNETKDT